MPAQLRKLEGPNSGPSPVVLGPLFEICAPHFTFDPLVAAYIQYSIFNMWPPILVYGPSFWFFVPPAAKSWRRAWPNYQHKFAVGRKGLFHFDVISLQYGRNCANDNYLFEVELLQHFLQMRKLSRAPRKALAATCGPPAVCCAGLI